VELVITNDLDKLEARLKELGWYTPKLAGKILRAVSGKMKARIRRYVYKHVKKDTGTLREKIYSTVKDANGFSRVGVISKYQYISQTLEYGKTILAKRHKYLTFQDKQGNWTKTKKVTVPAHPFFFNEVDAFLRSPEYQNTLDKTLDKEITRLWSKKL